MTISKKLKGVTLIEILLVLAVLGAVFAMMFSFSIQRTDEVKRTRAILQMQQILDAGLAFYIANGRWPKHTGEAPLDIDELRQGGIYLPPPEANFKNPWGFDYFAKEENGLWYVYTNALTRYNAYAIAGKLPRGFRTRRENPLSPPQGCLADVPCYAVASVNIPGQNLSQAGSFNFASLYHSGSCVPVPQCPVDKDGNALTPEIIVLPVAVSGAFEKPLDCSIDSEGHYQCNNIKATPITSMSAYATGPKNISTSYVPACAYNPQTFIENTACYADQGTTTRKLTTGTFWRVCLAVNTSRGVVKPKSDSASGTGWGQSVGSVVAITRCVVAGEYKGSSFNVWGS